MSGARIDRPNAMSKIVFFPAKDHRGMVNSIDLGPEKLKGNLPRQALAIMSV